MTFTLNDLTRILRHSAGADESVDLDGDIGDTSFDDLGYESLALLETGGQIERELGISLDDDTVAQARTPREFVELVNQRLLELAH